MKFLISIFLVWLMMMEEIFSDAIHRCLQPLDPGDCGDDDYYLDNNALTQWFFINGWCFPFMYSGCKGNGNRFSTMDHCYSICNDYLR